MASCLNLIKPLSPAQYAKATFRKSQAELSYPEKVMQLVAMQQRLAPIYAMRGIKIVPWRIQQAEHLPKGGVA